MPVDIVTEIVIARPRSDVAAYVADPSHAPEWYVNIKRAEWRTPARPLRGPGADAPSRLVPGAAAPAGARPSGTPPPLAVGSRLAFTAHFLGRKLEYEYDVIEYAPGSRLAMRTAEGPFPMETAYTWEDAGSGATRMTLRNRGEPSGFAKIAAPMMASAMRRANTNDLARLKGLLEAR